MGEGTLVAQAESLVRQLRIALDAQAPMWNGASALVRIRGECLELVDAPIQIAYQTALGLDTAYADRFTQFTSSGESVGF